MTLVFMGSGEFALYPLLKLLKSEHKVSAIYTKGEKNNPILNLAHENSIQVFTPNSLKSEDHVTQLKMLAPTICVVASYGLIIPSSMLNIPVNGFINIHPSSLPRWRGAAPIQRAIISGDRHIHVCIMQMDSGLDTGNIILSQLVELKDETYSEILPILSNIGANLLLEALELIKKNTTIFIKQAEDGITYADKIKNTECMISYDKTGYEVHNLVRGLSKIACAFLLFQQKRLNLIKSTLLKFGSTEYQQYLCTAQVLCNLQSFSKVHTKHRIELQNADLLFAKKKGIGIYFAGDRSILILEIVQLEGKKIMSGADFSNGLLVKI
ncbi:Methionyl-tRNA formyltransferase [Candidatus Fokinia solitaria]|uniref:Methionyl-tRNA formyltransferase n=1 Tax=Candidatus Fokinia solitaria TaxID=1802984 RepID=A0A2U8BTD2_9RICK|nr:methionyl-tRNA formyltransferase [Candidatus Fokinia solitaria]AWD33500.1 Methionyl-tRNA formyltransferase [Candidatus Fokinia solitaria]